MHRLRKWKRYKPRAEHRTLMRQMWDEQEKPGDMYSSDKRNPEK